MTKTIPTTNLPNSAFRDAGCGRIVDPECGTRCGPTDRCWDCTQRDFSSGIPTPIDTEPTLPTNVACLPGRDYVSPYTAVERCRCGAIVEGVDQRQLRVVVHPASKTQPRRVYIVSCPMCPNRR